MKFSDAKITDKKDADKGRDSNNGFLVKTYNEIIGCDHKSDLRVYYGVLGALYGQ